MDIYELSEAEVRHLSYLFQAAEASQVRVKIAMDGGFKVKAGTWTAPMGDRVDGNGDRI